MAPTVRLSIRPNPVQAGQEIEFRWGAAPGLAGETTRGALDVYDLGGRRVAVVDLEPQGSQLRGRIAADLTRPWQAGVYFVRPRGTRGLAQRLVVLR
jgi:hypothetical protein